MMTAFIECRERYVCIKLLFSLYTKFFNKYEVSIKVGYLLLKADFNQLLEQVCAVTLTRKLQIWSTRFGGKTIVLCIYDYLIPVYGWTLLTDVNFIQKYAI